MNTHLSFYSVLSKSKVQVKSKWRLWIRPLMSLFFFYWLFIVALTARSYRDCRQFSVLGMVFYWYFWNSAVTNEIFPYTWQTSIGPCPKLSPGHVRREQPWVQATPSIVRDIYRAVSRVVFGLRPTWTIMRSDNPIYELLYEFTLHFHPLGNLSIRSSPFWQQWFQISRNSKH